MTGLAYAVPMILTVIFSVLTCLKVKKDVLDENRSVIRSVVVLSTFNIFTGSTWLELWWPWSALNFTPFLCGIHCITELFWPGEC